MSTETIQKLIDAYFENMAAMNADGFVDTLAEDVEIYDPVGSPAKGREDLGKLFDILSKFYQKMEVMPGQIFIAGNGGSAQWYMRVTAKNGKKATAQGIGVFEINEAGKIQKVSSYWDENALLAQLKD